jgi:hypothetical protein
MTRHIKNIFYTLTFFALVAATSCDQQKKVNSDKSSLTNSDDKFRLLTYGGPPDLVRQSATNVVAEKWGIEYLGVAGCVVTKNLVDSVDRNNSKVEILIEKKYGKDWQTKFDKEVDEELINQKIASSLLDKEKKVIRKRNELEKKDNGLYYSFHPIDKDQYNVNATGWGQINGKDEYLIYLKYFVDINKKTVKLISDSVTKE